MASRLLYALAGILLLAAPGCQHALKNDGPYLDLTEHATRLDDEFHNWHADIRAIFFGIDARVDAFTGHVYGGN